MGATGLVTRRLSAVIGVISQQFGGVYQDSSATAELTIAPIDAATDSGIGITKGGRSMSPVIVRIEHLFDQTPAKFRREVAPFAPALAEVDGLLWKVWLIDAGRRAGGGIYLFRDRAAAQAYVDGPFCDWMRESPVLRDLRISIFDVVGEPSRITRAPLSAAAARLAA